MTAIIQRFALPALDMARRAAGLLHEGRGWERGGCMPEAIERYESAIATAEQEEEHPVLAEALRRLAVLRHHGGNRCGRASSASGATTWRGRSTAISWRRR